MSSKEASIESRCKPRTAGDAILDLVVFMPLFLFFLFVVVDGGLAWRSQAATRDAIRAGLNASGLRTKKLGPLNFTLDNGLQYDHEKAEELSEDVAAQLAGWIAPLVQQNTKYGTPFKVSVAPLVLSIDQQSGRIDSSYWGSEKHSGNILFDITQEIPDFKLRSKEDFVQAKLVSDQPPSQYALPTSQGLGVAGVGMGYMEKTVLLYVEVTALPWGTNSEFVKKVLGGYFGLQDQELIILRSQLM